MFCYISQLSVDGFSGDFYNRDSFDETIEMRGNNSLLTLKLFVFKYLSFMLMDFHETSITGFLLIR